MFVTNDLAVELHKKLMETLINFCIEKSLKLDTVLFSADEVSESVEYGSWHPATDSALKIYDINGISVESM